MISLTTIRPQLRRYLRSIAWLARDGLSGNGWRFFLIVVSNFVGVSTAASSMGLVILYVNWAGDPDSIPIPSISMPDDPTLQSLVVGVTALLLGVISAIGIYIAEYRTQMMTRDYQQRCMSRVLEFVGHRQIGRIIIEFERTSPYPLILQNFLTTGSRFAAFSLRAVVGLVLPVMTLLFATAVLIWKGPLITLILASLLGFYLVPLYLINRGVAKHHRRFRSLVGVANSGARNGLRSLLQTSGPVRNARYLRDDILFESDDFRDMQDSLYGRILATSRLVFVNSVFLILLVVILLLVSSALIDPDDKASWTDLLVYVVALRFAWTSVRQVTAKLTKLSQFFPEFEKLRDLVRAAERVDRSSRPKARAAKEPILLASRGNADPALGDADGRLQLQRGRPILAIYPNLIDRPALERLNITVWPRAGFPGDCVFHDDPAPIAEVTVLTNALGETPSKDAIDDLNVLLGRWGVLDELRSLPQGLDTVLTQNLIRSLSPEDRYALMAAYCVLEEPSFVFLTLSGLAKTQTQFQQTFLASIEHAHVFIVDAMAPLIFNARVQGVREHIDHVVIVPSDEVLRCVPISWLEQNITAVDRVLSLLRQQRVPGELDEQLSDEEEMEV